MKTTHWGIVLENYPTAALVRILLALPCGLARMIRNSNFPELEWPIRSISDLAIYLVGAGLFLGFFHTAIVLLKYPFGFLILAAAMTPNYQIIVCNPKVLPSFILRIFNTSFSPPESNHSAPKRYTVKAATEAELKHENKKSE